jgi:FSR family fosmidomycin resistance protein-like MFS transporter
VSPSPPAVTEHRNRWNLRALAAIAFAHGVNDFYSGIVPLIIFYVISREHLSPVYQGAIGFAWYFTSSIVQPLLGMYSDRSGRWWFLPFGVTLTVSAVSLAGTAHSLALLALCVVIGGFGSAIMHPEAGKYAAMLSGARKATGISIFQIGGSIGFSFGPAIIAAMLARWGSAGSVALLAPGALAVGLLFVLMRRVDRAARRHHVRAAVATATAGDARVDGFGVALLVISTALRHLVSTAFMTYLPNLLTARAYSLAAAGEIVTAFLIVSTVGMYVGGEFADRIGALRVSIGSLCAAVPFLSGFFLVRGGGGLVLLLVGSVLLAVQNAPGVALVQAMLPRNLGTALGLMNGVAFGLGSAAVTAVGFVVARSGPAIALELVSLVPLLSALAFVIVGRRGAVPRPAGISRAARAEARRPSKTRGATG